MATIREYFETDFSQDLSAKTNIEARSPDGTVLDGIVGRVHFNFLRYVKYVSYLVPSTPKVVEICSDLIANPDSALSASAGVEAVGNLFAEKVPTVSSAALPFTGRVFLYLENDLTSDQTANLMQVAQAREIALHIQGPSHANRRSAFERPVAFICHDSRDKEAIARPLAVELSKLQISVWFDEFSLRVGDSLRENIERGLKECQKCVLILSPSFLSNCGWTKVEFNSIFHRELLEKKNLILPVWHEVSESEVFDYCPSLKDRLAVSWSAGLDEVVRALRRGLQ